MLDELGGSDRYRVGDRLDWCSASVAWLRLNHSRIGRYGTLPSNRVRRAVAGWIRASVALAAPFLEDSFLRCLCHTRVLDRRSPLEKRWSSPAKSENSQAGPTTRHAPRRGLPRTEANEDSP